MNFFASVLESVAKFVASTSNLLCGFFIFDEPVMPEEMIK